MSLPKSYYDAKQLVSKMGLKAKKIDCCVWGCMHFYDNDSGKKDATLLECKFGHKPRYCPIHQGSRRKLRHIWLGIMKTKAKECYVTHLIVKPGNTLIVNPTFTS